MKGKMALTIVLALELLLGLALVAGPGMAQAPPGDTAASPLGSGFTYQGQLKKDGDPVNSTCDLRFRLYDSELEGSQIGPVLDRAGVGVVEGLFTVPDLDFGADAFSGDARWLEIAVQCSGDAGNHTLSPRQKLTAAPYALYAPAAGSAPWSGLTGVPGGFADGTDDDTTYSPGAGLTLVDTTFAADSSYLQRRVGDSCAEGNAIRLIDEDGGVTCQPVGGTAGDISAVHAGEGLSGGGTSGPVTLTLDLDYASARFVNEAQANSVTSAMIGDGEVTHNDLWDGAALDEILDDDGPGSGLDADLLDGQEGSYYLDWNSLTGVPPDLGDGDDDTLDSLSCGGGQVAKWDGFAWLCAADEDTAYEAGNQLDLSGTTLNVVEGPDSGLDADLLDGQQGSFYRDWTSLNNVPPGLDDGDDDTTYSAGNQLDLVGTTFHVAEGSGSGLDADLLDGQQGSFYRDWTSLNNVPPGLDDGDDDTTYSAGNQLDLVGTTFHVVEGPGSGLDADLLDGQQGSFYRDWESLTNVPPGFDDDVDNNTTYSAGTGLSLSGTQFRVGTTYRLPQGCGSGQVAKWNGSGWSCQDDDIGPVGGSWSLSGNAGTSPGAHFVGTTDNQALELKVNNARALRLEPDDISPNLIGGHSNNAVTDSAARGATISGGGYAADPNQVTDSYGTVGGGFNNSSDLGSTIGGGGYGTASGIYATIGGGYVNKARGNYSTIGGGIYGYADGQQATVPGGYDNEATGDYSFAAGRSAKALHTGSFVWADSTNADFASSNSNQFNVRATNGVDFLSDNGSYGLRVDNNDTSTNGDGIRAYAQVSKGDGWGAVYAINSGSSPAVYASSAGTYSGYFAQSIYVSGSCTGCSITYVAQNDGTEPLETGDLVAVSGVDEPLAGTSQQILRVQRAGPGSTAAIIGVVESRAKVTGSSKDGQYLESAGQVEGPAGPGEHLFLVVHGLAQVKADATTGAIAAGQRLAAAGRAGHARPLQTRMLDGMEVSEGAPVLGIALAPLDKGTGLIPVFVTLQ